MVAAVAMIAGLTYAEARKLVEASYDKGIYETIADDVLGELGFALIRRYLFIPRLKRPRLDTEWPPVPFAPAHMALVHVAAGAHAVAMNEHGHVFDPWKPERTELTHPDYLRVDWVTGYWKIYTS